jgi:hypothetical protein
MKDHQGDTMVFYSVKARFIEEKLGEFYQKLTDDTVVDQKPDGQEIVDSMKRAKITATKTIQWSETCFCPTPLKHEQATVYDHFLTNFETQTIDDYVEFEGESFFGFLERQFKK